MDTRLKIIIVISVISLILLAIAWNMTNKIASLNPSTAQAQSAQGWTNDSL